ncbi:zinc finger protein 862-like [Dreissena polymorpha]|uniref:zinc finger protein 862-like n=1 Tax=Dreissena polymorpha TaxID=45954 RepID=UPI00226407D1|nr:zinc finger protein 862-like [Dreissena polymorpha]
MTIISPSGLAATTASANLTCNTWKPSAARPPPQSRPLPPPTSLATQGSPVMSDYRQMPPHWIRPSPSHTPTPLATQEVQRTQNHLTALERTTLKAQKPMQKLLAAKINMDDELALNLLKTAYHIAKRELPKGEMQHMVDYASFLGVDFCKSATSSASHTNHQSVSELQSAIAEVILEDSLQEVKDSHVFSLTIDESTDNGNLKRVLMYTQFVKEGALKYRLLTNKVISEGSACAVNIVSMVLEELKTKGLDISKMVGIGTDGASVMTGRTGGVVKLLQEHSPSLIGVHCAAHREALATSQAAKHIPDMNEYSRTIMNIFKYFKNSALRSNRLRTIQILLMLPELKYAEVHSVRWLSMEHAVQVVYRTYPALVMALEREAAFEPAAKGLLQDVNQFKFIAITHLMMDILPQMTLLSKKFQEESVDFSLIKPVIRSSCESLLDLLEVSGVFVEKLSKFVHVGDHKVTYSRPLSESDCNSVNEQIQQNIHFKGFTESDIDASDGEDDDENVGFTPELRYYTQQKHVLDSIGHQYIQKLTDNLIDRFCDTNILECMKVLIPSNISEAESVTKYGLDELDKLIEHFEMHLPQKENARSEFQTYKRLVKGSYSKMSVTQVLRILVKGNDLPNIVMLLKCCVVIPMTSVQCERGFSTQNRIKSKSRTSLKSKALDDLMRISGDGPTPGDFDFGRALQK